MTGLYVLSFALILGLVFFEETTLSIFRSASLKAELWILNLRIKWSAWRIYRSLCAFSKKHNLPAPGPFVYVDIWDRD